MQTEPFGQCNAGQHSVCCRDGQKQGPQLHHIAVHTLASARHADLQASLLHYKPFKPSHRGHLAMAMLRNMTRKTQPAALHIKWGAQSPCGHGIALQTSALGVQGWRGP